MFDVIIDNRSMNDAGLKVASRPLVLSPEKKYQTRTALNRDGALYRCAGHGALLAGESPASTYLPVRVEKRKRTYDCKGVRERSVYQSSEPTNRNRI